jgi:DNA replication protein DnaC
MEVLRLMEAFRIEDVTAAVRDAMAELELIEREGRMVERRIKAAKFPAVKSLDSFDFAAL